MEDVAQLVRASDCGSEGRGFEPHHSPKTPARQEFFLNQNLTVYPVYHTLR